MHIANIAKYFLYNTGKDEQSTRITIFIFLIIRTLWENYFQIFVNNFILSWSTLFLFLMEFNNFMLTYSIFCFLQRGNHALERKLNSLCHFT